MGGGEEHLFIFNVDYFHLNVANGLKTIIHRILTPEIKIYIAEEFSCKLFSVERTEIESKRVEKDMPDKQFKREPKWLSYTRQNRF